MPMQVFEFQADTTVSLVSPAAINRKSCDHCFLNRKTCDKVRQAADSGEKCKRCAKDNRPCTFTPTVHLYHIADCVGRHQCRAKVIQAMGGRKKEVQFKTIEIPIVCDMDSAVDQALFDFIQKQPNLLVYNNRIKSFLAQDMLGISADQDFTSPPLAQYNSGAPNYQSISPSSSPSSNSKRSFSNELASYGSSSSGMAGVMTSPAQGPSKYRVMSPLESQQQQYQQVHPHQQQVYRSHPYAHHQRSNSDDRGRQSLSPRPGYNSRPHPGQSYHSSRHTSLPDGDALVSLSGGAGGRLSPLSSPNALLPLDASGTNAPIMTSPATNPYGGMYQQQMQVQMQQQTFPQLPQQHPYAQQSPYPTAAFFHQPQAQIPQQQQQQQQMQQHQMNSYRTTSPFPASPLAPSPIPSIGQGSPQPPSPLELSLAVNTNFGAMGNNDGSPQNLDSLFGTTLTMGSHQQQQQQQQCHPFHRQELSSCSTRSSLSASASPAMSTIAQASNEASTPFTGEECNPAPLVVTTLNEDGNEVGFYYAVPTVNLNPGASDADLFQDFTMMDALGEDFVWIENLFDEATAGVNQEEGQSLQSSNNTAANAGVPAGSYSALSSAIPMASDANSTASMEGLMSQYVPQE